MDFEIIKRKTEKGPEFLRFFQLNRTHDMDREYLHLLSQIWKFVLILVMVYIFQMIQNFILHSSLFYSMYY